MRRSERSPGAGRWCIRTRRAVVALAISLAASVSGASAQNLLENGSFELPANQSPFVSPPAMPGWTKVAGTAIELQNRSLSNFACTPLAAADGTQWWEAAGSTPEPATALQQTVGTLPGATYTLSFAFAARNSAPAVNALNVFWDGALVLSPVLAKAPTCVNTSFTTIAIDVVATGTSSTVRLAYAGPADVTAGALVDDVRLILKSLNNDLTLTLSRSGPLQASQIGAQYTIGVTNAGTGPAIGTVTVADSLPPGLTATAIAGSGWRCTLDTLTCVRDDSLPPGGGYPPIVVTVNVSASPPETIANAAVVSGGGDTSPANNRAVDVAVILPADLAIVKSRPLQGVAGAALTYSLRIENLGPGAASGVVVNDPTPDGLTFVSTTGACVTAFPCALGAIPNGEIRTIGVTFFVPASYAGSDPIVNVATVTATTADPNGANNTATALTPLGTIFSFNVGVTKAGPANVLPGRNLTYTLTVTNSGTADATGVTLTDPTPPGLTFVGNTGDCATPFPCLFGTLGTGESRVVTATFAVPGEYRTPDPIVNTATVSSTSADENPIDNTSTTTTAVVPPWADIAVSTVVDVPAPLPGQIVTFIVTVSNHGSNAATGVELVDRLPVGLTLIGATPAQGIYDPPTGRWTIGALAVGASTTLTLTAQVMLPGTIVNTATKIAGDQPDPNDSNNSASVALTTQPVADVRVLVLVDRPTVNVGETVAVTVILRNAGPDAATSVLTRISVPPGLVPLSAAALAAGAVDPSGQWTIGSLAAGGTATLGFVARVTEPTALPITARKIAQTEFDPDLANDAGGAVVNGLAADIQMVKTADATTLTMGQRLRFTIVATNNGPSEATNLVVRDALGPNLAFVSATPSAGLYDPATGLWSIGTLAAAGPTNVATLRVETVVVATGLLSNTAAVQSAGEPDPNVANNQDSADFQSAALDLAASLSAIGDFGALDTVVKFFVGIANVSEASSVGRMTFMATLPPELEFLSPPVGWTCVATGGVVSCFTDGLVVAPGQQMAAIFFAAVRGILAEPTFVPLVIANAADVNAVNNVASLRVDATLVIDPADLEVRQTVTPSIAAPGGAFAAAIDIENHGPDPARRVVTLHALPDGLTLAAAPPGACHGDRLVVCDLGRLAAGAIAHVTLQVAADAPGVYRLVSSATSLEDDPRPADNQTVTVVTVSGAVPPGSPPGGAAPPFGYVDLPPEGATVAGAVAVGGWALDDVEVARVRIYRDPVAPESSGTLIYVGDAVRVRGARPDVERAFPGVPFVDRAGWGLLVLTNTLPNRGNGTFRLHAIAEDRDGQRTLLGSRTIVADNASSITPFGTIDTPGQGETIGGTAYVNFGWALTPPPKTIPADGSTILVLVDGQALGTVSYNHPRDDVATLFPDYANAPGAIGYRVIDTMTLTNGLHTISWTVTDDAGVTEGLGSRYFGVDNAARSTGTVAAAMRVTAAVEGRPTRGAPAPRPVRVVVVDEMRALQISLRGLDGVAGCPVAFYQGFEDVDQRRGPLPVGSTFDPGAGSFTWQPGPGFIGRYRLVFTRASCAGDTVEIPIDVIVRRQP